MGHAYERELRDILSGDPDALDKMTRTGGPKIVSAYRQPARDPFLMVRAAGSLGTGDLVAMRNGFGFLIEVKAAGRDTIHFSESSGALHEQAEAITDEADRAGVLALYAFRLKGHRKKDPWRIFALPCENLEGRGKFLARRTPTLPRTDSGTHVLRWDEGRPLHRFLTHYYEVFGDGLQEPVPA